MKNKTISEIRGRKSDLLNMAIQHYSFMDKITMNEVEKFKRKYMKK